MEFEYHEYKSLILQHDIALSYEHKKMSTQTGDVGGTIVKIKSLPDLLHELRFGNFRPYASLFLIFDEIDPEVLDEIKQIFNECYHLKYLTKVLLIGCDHLVVKLSEFDISETNMISIWPRKRNDEDSTHLTQMISIVFSLHKCYDGPLQEQAHRFCNNIDYSYFQSKFSTNEGLYLLNINPALGVIINHNTFLKRKTRRGSEKDVQTLIESFERKHMPYIIISDGSAEDVHRCIELLGDSFMCAFEAIFVFVMSHGGYGEIIYTKTLDYQIDEHIVAPLTSNASLCNAKIYIFVNACRGKYDPQRATFKDKDNVIPTDTRNQPNNVVKFFSTKINRVSKRNVNSGSDFIQKFCELFNQIYFEHDMDKLAMATEAQVAQNSLFKNGTTEYCTRPGTQHTLKVTFRNFNTFQKVLMNMDSRIKGQCERANRKRKSSSLHLT